MIKINKLNPAQLKQMDTDLFNTILHSELGVVKGTRQFLKWFIDVQDLVIGQVIVNELNKVLPGVKSFSKYSININVDFPEPIVSVTAGDFAFTLNDIAAFSKIVYDIATNNGCHYDYWEITVDSSKQKSKKRR